MKGAYSNDLSAILHQTNKIKQIKADGTLVIFGGRGTIRALLLVRLLPDKSLAYAHFYWVSGSLFVRLPY